MLVSYNWLKDYLKGTVPSAKKLADLLSLHSFEVEDVKRKNNDWLINVDVLPNRAHDCLSFIGVARECSVITKNKMSKPSFSVKEDKEVNGSDFISVEVKEKELCPRYNARVLIDVKVDKTPERIKERLEVLGLQSINNIVDILNYVMIETGQPLHAFDLDKLAGNEKKKIIVRKAERGEKIDALDDNQYKLGSDVLVIADEKDVLAIAGIKGGRKAEITEETKNIVIESANFDMLAIRRARQKLSLQTDASLRFEHEPDPNLTILAINRAAQIVKDLCGGKVAKGVIDVYPRKVKSIKIKLNLSQVKSLLGIEIDKKIIIDILKNLELKILSSKGEELLIEIPTFRKDLSIPQDLIEEIGRIYGFDRIPARTPYVLAIPPERNNEIFWENKCKDILKECNFSEVYNYSFISEKEADSCCFSKNNLIEVKNPISLDHKYLRPSLISGILGNTKKNLKNFSEIRIFELGKTYHDFKELEKRFLTGMIVDPINNSNNFFVLKGILDFLFESLGIADVWYDEFEPTPENSALSIWKSGSRAEIKIGSKEIGFLGEISLKTLEEFNILERVFAFNIDFDKLQAFCTEEHEYQPVSRFPAAIRDLAVLVPSSVKVVEVLNLINNTGGSLIRDVDIFDIYDGSGVPEGKKNLAFHIIYQAEDRTLEKEEIETVQKKIINALEEKIDWEVRK
jgi:phenylalanyl-tRNA synthetase beta chain